MSQRLVRRQTQPLPGAASPLLSRLFTGRGIQTSDEIDCSLARLLLPTTMLGLVAAGKLLADCIEQQQRILIVGDFDADGATSSALMVHGLTAMGALHVNYLVPNRFEYGYGLTPEIVQLAAGTGAFQPEAGHQPPQLIITVDNGISSGDGIDLAKSLGIKVLVTDHHLPGDVLPDADVIVNPNQPGCGFPSKNLAGVGVAFYLLTQLRQTLRKRGWFDQADLVAPNLADYLDLVALGTIADVVVLDQNNRILVSEGIRRIRAGRCRPGITGLLEIAGVRQSQLASRDLAFGIGPRLNAAGRLDDMALGIECLLSPSIIDARAKATHLDNLNKERRVIENEMKTQAQANLKLQHNLTPAGNKTGVCLYDDDWHQGVIGIVASRIKDQLHRPVIAFAPAGDNEMKGSARSIRGLHIRDALAAIDAKNPGLIQKFGGHAMAAGLTIEAGHFEQFARLFDEQASSSLSTEDLEQVLISDGELNDKVTLSLVREVLQAVPWGQGFPEPLFDGEFEILQQRIVGQRHLKLSLLNGDQTFDAIAFNQDRLIDGRNKRMAYRLDINEYRGVESVQLIIECVDVSLDSTRK
ncbi:single-stranded-DNA-specific exonuclease RecJ [Pseudomonadales bacterium]|nr:single-stranded-DNA-specific exonuclease RecJ [Pseudomonadales bacterium]MDB9942346.1 single-stranded-DNA-specific exonuclease RecJ [Pseudomonadales bacterium]